jgi:hypothetical protein
VHSNLKLLLYYPAFFNAVPGVWWPRGWARWQESAELHRPAAAAAGQRAACARRAARHRNLGGGGCPKTTPPGLHVAGPNRAPRQQIIDQCASEANLHRVDHFLFRKAGTNFGRFSGERGGPYAESRGAPQSQHEQHSSRRVGGHLRRQKHRRDTTPLQAQRAGAARIRGDQKEQAPGRRAAGGRQALGSAGRRRKVRDARAPALPQIVADRSEALPY